MTPGLRAVMARLIASCDKLVAEEKVLRMAVSDSEGEEPGGDVKFECAICLKDFSSNWCLQIHVKTHDEKRSFDCHECGMTFPAFAQLYDHLKQHIFGEDSIEDVSNLEVCSVCGKEYPVSQIAMHQRSHIFKPGLTCTTCGKSFGSSQVLKLHLRTHGSAILYQCKICGLKFVSRNSFMLHWNSHGTNKLSPVKSLTKTKRDESRGNACNLFSKYTKIGSRYKCTICSKQFSTSAKMEVHSLIHQSPTKKKTQRKLDVGSEVMDQHQAIKDTLVNENPPFWGFVLEQGNNYFCSVCKKDIKGKSRAVRHAKYHFYQERPKSHLETVSDHLEVQRIHEKQLNIDKAVKTKGNNSRAKSNSEEEVRSNGANEELFSAKTHDEGTQACSECDKTFMSIDDLQQHEKVHLQQYAHGLIRMLGHKKSKDLCLEPEALLDAVQSAAELTQNQTDDKALSHPEGHPGVSSAGCDRDTAFAAGDSPEQLIQVNETEKKSTKASPEAPQSSVSCSLSCQEVVATEGCVRDAAATSELEHFILVNQTEKQSTKNKDHELLLDCEASGETLVSTEASQSNNSSCSLAVPEVLKHISTKHNQIICKICSKEFYSMEGVSVHIKSHFKRDNDSNHMKQVFQDLHKMTNVKVILERLDVRRFGLTCTREESGATSDLTKDDRTAEPSSAVSDSFPQAESNINQKDMALVLTCTNLDDVSVYNPDSGNEDDFENYSSDCDFQEWVPGQSELKNSKFDSSDSEHGETSRDDADDQVNAIAAAKAAYDVDHNDDQEELPTSVQDADTREQKQKYKTTKLNSNHRNLRSRGTSHKENSQSQPEPTSSLKPVESFREHRKRIKDYISKRGSYFYCEICMKNYTSMTKVYVHVQYHLKERKHKCEHCGKSFKDRKDILRHIMYHVRQNEKITGFSDEDFKAVKNNFVDFGDTFTCLICNYNHKSRLGAYNHALTHLLFDKSRASDSDAHNTQTPDKLYGSSEDKSAAMCTETDTQKISVPCIGSEATKDSSLVKESAHNREDEVPFDSEHDSKRKQGISELSENKFRDSTTPKISDDVPVIEINSDHKIKQGVTSMNPARSCNRIVVKSTTSYSESNTRVVTADYSKCLEGDHSVRAASNCRLRTDSAMDSDQCDSETDDIETQNIDGVREPSVNKDLRNQERNLVSTRQTNKSSQQTEILTGRTVSRNIWEILKEQCNNKSDKKPEVAVEKYDCVQCCRQFSKSNQFEFHKLLHQAVEAIGENLQDVQRNRRLSQVLTCPVCKKEYPTMFKLRNHVRVHTDEKKFKCDICGLAFKSRSYFKTHQNIHNNKRPFHCHLCSGSFPGQNLLNQHIKKTHKKRKGSKIMACNVCGKRLTKISLTRHRCLLTKDKHVQNYPCDFCEKKFFTQVQCRSHEKIHADVKQIVNKPDDSEEVVVNTESGMTNNVALPFKDSQGVKSCDQTDHFETRDMDKEVAESSFVTQDVNCESMNHPSTRQTDDSSGKTDLLAAKTTRKNISETPKELDNNKSDYRHDQDSFRDLDKKQDVAKEKYKCAQCCRYFSKSSLFENHKLVHQAVEAVGENLQDVPKNSRLSQVLTCPVCKKEYPTVFKLREHVRVHTDEKKFKCDVCGLAFYSRSYFQTHTNIHNNKRPFHCHLCSGEFHSKNFLNIHIKRTHKKKNHSMMMTCNACGKRLTKASLKQHRCLQTKDKYVQSFPRDFCRKNFYAQQQCKSHKKIHSNVKQTLDKLDDYGEVVVNTECVMTDNINQPVEKDSQEITSGVPSMGGKELLNNVETEAAGNTDKIQIDIEIDQKRRLGNLKPSEDKLKGTVMTRSPAENGTDRKIGQERTNVYALNDTNGSKIRNTTPGVKTVMLEGGSSDNVTPCYKLRTRRLPESSSRKDPIYSSSDEELDVDENLTEVAGIDYKCDLETDDKETKDMDKDVQIAESSCVTQDLNCQDRNHISKGQIDDPSEKTDVLAAQTMRESISKTSEEFKSNEKYECVQCCRHFSKSNQFEFHKLMHQAVEDIGENLKDIPRRSRLSQVLTCPVCKKEYHTFRELSNHVRVHTDERKFKCDVCGLAIKTQSQLLVHQDLHKRKPFKCDLCRRKFAEENVLQQHFQEHHGEESKEATVVTCDDSSGHAVKVASKIGSESAVFTEGESSEEFNQVKQKNKSKVGSEACCQGSATKVTSCVLETIKNPCSKPNIGKYVNKIGEKYCCTICKKKFELNIKCYHHVLYHFSKKKRHACQECDYSSTSKFCLRMHVNKHQKKRAEFPCNICHCVFSELSYLMSHLDSHSDEEKIKHLNYLECPTCGIACKNSKALYRHKLQHLDTFQCKCCDVVLPSAVAFENHTNEKGHFYCEDCGKAYANFDTLQKHQKKGHKAKPFQCNQCPKRFVSNQSLKLHVRSHVVEYTCKICKGSFQSRKELKLHKVEKNHEVTSGQYTCDICHRHFSKTTVFEAHKLIHQALAAIGENIEDVSVKSKLSQVLTCPVCKREYPTLFRFRAHVRIHTEEKRFKCDICGLAFKCRFYFQTHQNIHNNKRPFHCDLCSGSFHSQNFLNEHVKKTHYKDQQEMMTCDVCGKKLRKGCMYQHRNLHKKKKHAKDVPCDLCEKKFYTVQQLKCHKKVHSNESVFMCDICGKFLRSKNSLRDHEKGHLGIKPFHCSICDKGFKNKQFLRNHLIVHSGEKAYKCEFCDKAFGLPETLKNHRNIHTGEKPYKCGLCGQSFGDRWARHRHRKRHGMK